MGGNSGGGGKSGRGGGGGMSDVERKQHITRLNADIRAGEMRLSSKINGAGERLSKGELSAIKNSISRNKKEIKKLK